MPDRGVLKISLRDCRHRPVGDPESHLSFVRTADGRVFRRHPKLIFRSNQRRVFRLPTVDLEWKMFYRFNPRHFHAVQSDIFSLVDGVPLEQDLVLIRDPRRSKADFLPWSSLGAPYAALKDLLRNAGRLRLFRPGRDDYLDLGPLLGAAYDNLDGDEAVTAKAAMLNVAAKMRETAIPAHGGATGSWIDHVQELLVLRPQRIIAVAQPSMVRVLEAMVANSGNFPEYRQVVAANHFRFFPQDLRDRFQIRRDGMFSFKTTENTASLQLTIAPGTDGGNPIHFLDADIDENNVFLKHLIDVLKHKFTGGTDPLYIHQLLCYPQPNIALGYELVPK